MSLFIQTNKAGGSVKANGTPRPNSLMSYVSTSSSDGLGGVLNLRSIYKPTAKRVTSPALLSGASVPGLRRNVMKIEQVKTRKVLTAIREGKYNMVTNKFSSTCGESGTDQCPDVVVDNFGTDRAASVGINNRGVLFYTLGHRIPVAANYRSNDDLNYIN